MSTLFYALIIIVPAVVLMLSAFFTFKRRMEGKSLGKTMRLNLVTFLVLIVMVSIFAFAASAQTGAPADVNDAQTETTAQTEQEVQTEENGSSSKGLGLLAAGLVTGLAGIGGGIAVAAGAPAAIAATSEDPKSFGKSLIFVALGESIALYGVVISILILNKI
ncbi:MAG: ATP synthase subunit C [Acutalibacteraceae bacterium]